MKVSDLIQTAVKTVTGDTPGSEIIVSFADVQVSGLPVVDSRGRAVGVVSSTDLITAQARARTAQERQILLEQGPRLLNPNRSSKMMNGQKDRDALEALIDRYGLSHVVRAVGELASLKSDHIHENWQDHQLAKAWQRDAQRIET
jgi:hypothetical protein